MISHFLTYWLYRPLFNFMILLYDIFNFLYPGISIGTVVIIFTIIFRLVILPLSWNNDYSEKEKRDIAEKVKKMEEEFKDQPDKIKEFKRKILWSHKKIVFFEIVNLALQVGIAVFLFAFFSTGIKGLDKHLLYSVIPYPKHINIYFHGIDLTIPNMRLNLLNSTIIFIVELLSIWNQPFPITQSDISTLIFLPIIAFLFFGHMPSGKKLFVITTLTFTIFIILVKKIVYWYYILKDKLAPEKKTENKEAVSSTESDTIKQEVVNG